MLRAEKIFALREPACKCMAAARFSGDQQFFNNVVAELLHALRATLWPLADQSMLLDGERRSASARECVMQVEPEIVGCLTGRVQFICFAFS